MFISGVSSNVYRVVKSLLLSIASYIQMTGKPDIMFIENTTFILKDSEDYIAEMERFVKMGDIRGAKQIEYKLKIGEGDEVGAKKLQYLLSYSPLQYTDVKDILLMQNVLGEGINELLTLKTFAESALEKVVQSKGTAYFMSASMDNIHSLVLKELPKQKQTTFQ